MFFIRDNAELWPRKFWQGTLKTPNQSWNSVKNLTKIHNPKMSGVKGPPGHIIWMSRFFPKRNQKVQKNICFLFENHASFCKNLRRRSLPTSLLVHTFPHFLEGPGTEHLKKFHCIFCDEPCHVDGPRHKGLRVCVGTCWAV